MPLERGEEEGNMNNDFSAYLVAQNIKQVKQQPLEEAEIPPERFPREGAYLRQWPGYERPLSPMEPCHASHFGRHLLIGFLVPAVILLILAALEGCSSSAELREKLRDQEQQSYRPSAFERRH